MSCCVAQNNLNPDDPPASAREVPGLQASATTAGRHVALRALPSSHQHNNPCLRLQLVHQLYDGFDAPRHLLCCVAVVVGAHPDHHDLWREGHGARVRKRQRSGRPPPRLLTLGRMCSSSPFSSRQSTCWVLSPPMPKLSACRGEKSSRQICGQKTPRRPDTLRPGDEQMPPWVSLTLWTESDQLPANKSQ